MDLHASTDAAPSQRSSISVKDKDANAIEQAEMANIPSEGRPGQRMLAPELVRPMSADERAHAEKVLVRKIDYRLLPAVIVMYILNYLDRNNIASARLAGLQDELGLTSTQYQTSVSILFVGYLLMQIPSNLLLNKIGLPAIYLPSVMIVWGVISTLTAATHNYGGLVANRFFLGFVEAAYFVRYPSVLHTPLGPCLNGEADLNPPL